MKLYLSLFFFFLLIATSCEEKNKIEPADSNQKNTDVWPMVKSVSWNVGVTHKLEFFYNSDSTLNNYLSGSSNLAWKYNTRFTYKNRRIDETRYDTSSMSKYVYDSEGRVKEIKHFNNSEETSRNKYSYNLEGKVVTVEWMVSANGSWNTSWQSTLEYDNEGNIHKTRTVTYNETGRAVDTITREIKQLSSPVNLHPYSLLHPLYQHQAQEIFDLVVLKQLKKLPLSISETGRSSTGPVNYEYHLSITNNLLHRLKCSMTIGRNPAYDTAEAIFEYWL